MSRRLVAVLVVACLALTVAATGCRPSTAQVDGGKGGIVVGSTMDTQGWLVGTMVKLVLENAGYRVTDKIRTGDAAVTRAALLNKEIDLCPDVTGSGLTYLAGESGVTTEAFRDGVKAFDLVGALDKRRNGVEWIVAAPADARLSIVTTRKFAADNRLATVSDLARLARSGKPVRVAGSDVDFGGATGWPAFVAGYGLAIPASRCLVMPRATGAAVSKAVADGTGGVSAGLVAATDGGITGNDLVVLADDRGVQVSRRIALVVRADALKRHPEIASLLEPAFARLTTDVVRVLSARIDINGQQPDEAAREYLDKIGVF